MFEMSFAMSWLGIAIEAEGLVGHWSRALAYAVVMDSLFVAWKQDRVVRRREVSNG